jgi:phosphomannomutase/phosphoglucomutase
MKNEILKVNNIESLTILIKNFSLNFKNLNALKFQLILKKYEFNNSYINYNRLFILSEMIERINKNNQFKLEKLKEKVKETSADVGIAFDGDGDRVGVITKEGKFLSIDKYMIVIWRDLVTKDVKKKTFYDVKCSLALKEELDKLGVENEFYRTGNSYTKEKSVSGDYPFSGELSGHVFFRDKFPGYDDGIYAGLRLVEILTHTEKSIEELLIGIPEYESTPELKVKTPDDIKFKVIDNIRKYCEEKKYKILTIDGVKVFFDDGTALVRASNTGPNITTRFEAKTKERLEAITKEFIDLIENNKKDLSIC